jgi:hypothetical protein
VILTRLLAFRNFAGFPFVASAPPNQCAAAAERALALVSRSGGPLPWRLADLPPRALRLLRERELIPWRAMAFPGKKGFKHLSAAADGSAWTLVNEVEHVTFGRVLPGSPDPEAAIFPNPGDDGEPWARSARFGYLASDPGRAGSGTAVEQILHLPGLALARELPAARNYLAAAGIAFLPAMPSPVSVPGPADAGLFRVASRGALGKTPRQAYAAHLEAVDPVLRRELEARARCLDKHPKRLKSKVMQSLEQIAAARSLAYPDLLAAGSLARLGSRLGILDPQIDGILEFLRVTVASGHLAVSSGRELAQEEEDFSRANVVRLSLEKYRGSAI